MNRNKDHVIPYSASPATAFNIPGYWIETLPNVAPADILDGPNKCDLAIIGGGFTGLSTAYHARKLMPGIDVRVVEANVCGYGSSGRNAGFSSPLFGMRKSITALRFGKENAVAAHHYMLDAVEYLEQLVEKHAIECDYERRGLMLVATSRAQTKRIEQELRIAEEWGLGGAERWDRPRLAKEFKSDLYRQGIFEEHCAQLNPARLARGLMRIAQEAGSTIYENSPVVGIEESPEGYSIRTPDGELRCERVVFATNAYSAVFPGLAASQTPVLQYIVLSEPLTTAQLNSIGWQSRIGFVDLRDSIHYYRLTADNRILMGGGDVLPPPGNKRKYDANPGVFLNLKKQITRIYPQLRDLKFSHQWGGLVSVSVDLAPAIATTGRNGRAIFSVGLMGHGVSMTPYNGLCIAELLANQKSERTEMFFVGRQPTPWPPHFIRYPVLQAVRGLLKLKDAR